MLSQNDLLVTPVRSSSGSTDELLTSGNESDLELMSSENESVSEE